MKLDNNFSVMMFRGKILLMERISSDQTKVLEIVPFKETLEQCYIRIVNEFSR